MAYAEKRVSTAKGTKGKVSWRARYKKPDGTWDSEPGFPTKATALTYGRKQEAAVSERRWIDPKLSSALFGDMARTWMASRSPRGTTITTRWARLETHILPRWEMVPLDDITWFDAEAWANSLECDDVTAGHCLTLMSQIMTGAVDKKMIPVNPLFGRKRQRSAEAKAEQEQKEQTELWVPPEAALQIARRLGRRNGMHILTTTFTGLRWGEGAGLHRDNALLERAEPHDGGTFRCPVLRVAQELAEYTVRRPDGTKDGMKIGIESVKTRAGRRDIDLPPFLAELLKEHLAAVRHDLVFSTPEGRPWRRSNFSRQILKPAAQGRTALPASKGHPPREEWAPIMPTATMRALRHTHDTLQAQIGVRPRLEYEQAGHEYPGIKGRYQHPTPDMRIARLEGLQEIYERALRSLGWKSVWGS